MQRVTQNNAAVFRTGETLDEGRRQIGDVHTAISDVRVEDRSLVWNSDLVETLRPAPAKPEPRLPGCCLRRGSDMDSDQPLVFDQ